MSKRPPKPDGIAPNPRFKAPRAPSEAGSAILNSLSALSRANPKRDHRKEFIQEINQEKNDRGAAILVVTNVENALRSCLQNVLANQNDQHDSLFGINRPMSTFDSKIRMAYAFGIIGPEMRWNLDVIRSVRNAFAHSQIPITFETKEVAKAALLLRKPDLFRHDFIEDAVFTRDWEISTTTRMKFITICNIMATNLARYAHSTVGYRALDRDHEKNPQLQIVVRLKPLP